MRGGSGMISLLDAPSVVINKGRTHRFLRIPRQKTCSILRHCAVTRKLEHSRPLGKTSRKRLSSIVLWVRSFLAQDWLRHTKR